jgi:hypothetical protein
MCKPEQWKQAGLEPTLAEVMADPIVHLVMARDGIHAAQVAEAVSQARQQMRAASQDHLLIPLRLPHAWHANSTLRRVA